MTITAPQLHTVHSGKNLPPLDHVPAHLCNVAIPRNWQADLLRDIEAAERSIHMTALSMLPPAENKQGPWPSVWYAFAAAVERGVRVDLHLPRPMKAHPATLQNATAAAAAHRRGIYTHYVPGPRLLHAKTCVIDFRIVWLGSANMTQAAFSHNHELWARIESHRFGCDLVTRIANMSIV